MDERQIEVIVINAMKLGTIATLKALGLLSEVVTKKEAERIYSRRLISDWRRKGWITGYPSGNKERSAVYFKHSELETASTMMALGNAVPMNRIFKDWMK